ncbi:sensor histidine kinase [Hymenobacter latericus]|uniref:sensor histidine kinase n=1 Tax=Hymenobacter sp. YIM 151858-1 TaxID=2987688 RepID=UPI002227169F|nr:PAS domain-containing protein [Hymenobacter sp. YIM 151858-1]UYZ59355.1 PAS domain-containing protein [Hymenobacter sp. YIM 151858-1]
MKYLYWLLAGTVLLAFVMWALVPAPEPAATATLGGQVVEFFALLLDPTGFPARWRCGRWTDFHGWLYILSDLLIWAAYFTIPFLLINFVRQRRDIPFDRLFWAFGLFIFACGATHLIDAMIFWVPVYRLSGLVRLLTAVASWGTVWALVLVLPRALLLKTPTELEQVVQARTAELGVANEQLRQREAEFSTLANAIPQLAWMAEATGDIFWYNQRWYEYTGTNFEQMSGWGWEKVHHPEHLGHVLEVWRRHLATGEPWEDTFPLRRHDGVFRWFLSRAVPIRDEHNRIVRWFGTNTDVTDMRELQEQVQRSEAQYRVLMESIPQLVWSADAQGQLTYCDGRTTDYTGQTPEQLRGQAWHTLLHPDDQTAALAQWAEARQTSGLLAGEYRLRRHTGEYRWFLVQARLLGSTAPEATGQWFGTCTDVHEQHTLREALQVQNAELARTNRELDTFVYAASHDLKQPVQNLTGLFAELKRTVTFSDPDAERMQAMVDDSLTQLLSTVQALGEVVRVQRQVEKLPPEPVLLQPLVEEVIRAVQDLGTTPPTWQLDFSALSAVVFVRANLRSVLYNLLSNAVKYADPSRPPVIAVRTEVADGVPVLVVQDNGLGIDLGRHGRELFHLFRRFHDHVPGTGVGLYLVQRLVEQAGGRLEVESAVGQGTTFRVYLHVA